MFKKRMRQNGFIETTNDSTLAAVGYNNVWECVECTIQKGNSFTDLIKITVIKSEGKVVKTSVIYRVDSKEYRYADYIDVNTGKTVVYISHKK